MLVPLVLTASIVVQVAAAVAALRLIRTTGWKSPWLLVAGAFCLMAVRRSISLAGVLSDPAEPTAVALGVEFVALSISVLLLLGVALLAPLLRATHEEAEERRRAEARARDLLERVNDWVWEVDDRPAFTYCSPRCEEILGYLPEELLGRHPHSLVAPEERERAARVFDEVTAARRPFVRIESVHLHKNGSRVVMETSGMPILAEDGSLLGYRGIDRDVTDRKRAERSLARVARALRVLSHATEVIIRAPDETSMLEEVCQVVVDEGSYRMAWVGYAESPEEGHRVNPVARWGDGADYVDTVRITWDDGPTGQGPTGRAIRTLNPVAQRNMEADPTFQPWRTAAGERGYEASLALPLAFEDHCYGALNVYAQDTDAFDDEEIELLERLAADVAFGIRTLRLREEREDLENLVIHKQRMESLGELTGGLAHDINNILTTILANAGMLEEMDGVDDPEFQASLHDIRSATENGAHLVRKLLAFSHSEPPALEELDLAEVAAEECRLLTRVLPATVVIEPSIGPGPMTVRADPRALDQIFMNFAFNARDAMPEGGTVRVRVYRTEVKAGEQGFHGAVPPGPYACIRFDDTGLGMDPETRSRLFEPFFTTKARGRGTGLGLAVVYGLVESHEGFLQVDSAPGKGTSMRVFLPLGDELRMPTTDVSRPGCPPELPTPGADR